MLKKIRIQGRREGKIHYLCTPSNLGLVPGTQVETLNGGAHLQCSTPAERCGQRQESQLQAEGCQGWSTHHSGNQERLCPRGDSAKPSPDLQMHGVPVMKRKCE